METCIEEILYYCDSECTEIRIKVLIITYTIVMQPLSIKLFSLISQIVESGQKM